MAEYGSYEDRTKGVEPMNKQEQEAMQRVKKSLEEWSGQRYAQHVLAEDLETLLRLIERSTKKPCDK